MFSCYQGSQYFYPLNDVIKNFVIHNEFQNRGSTVYSSVYSALRPKYAIVAIECTSGESIVDLAIVNLLWDITCKNWELIECASPKPNPAIFHDFRHGERQSNKKLLVDSYK